MHYAIYKNIRHSSWQCLIDFNVRSLPVDVLQIARTTGIKVIRNSSVHVLQAGENGKSFFDGSNWIIIYDDLNSTELSRFTIAHELGHIFLGHELSLGRYPQTQEITKKPKSEQQADMFAIRLLCPACVLWGLELNSSEEIAQICRVKKDIANTRSQRMRSLYKRNKFLTDPMEKQLYSNFEEYIIKSKIDREK